MYRLLLGTALAALPLTILHAQDTPREGAAYWQNVTVVNLSGEAHRKVSPDQLTATLSIQHEAKDAAGAQEFVNKKMQLAKAAAEQAKGITFETGNYNTYAINMPEPGPIEPATRDRMAPVRNAWHAEQQITFKGADTAAVTRLAAQLQQQGFALQGLDYGLSRAKSDEIRDELTSEALANLKTRAQKIADQLGMKNVRYATINTNDADMPQPISMMRGKNMAFAGAEAPMPEPVASAGEMELQVNVTAEVHLR